MLIIFRKSSGHKAVDIGFGHKITLMADHFTTMVFELADSNSASIIMKIELC